MSDLLKPLYSLTIGEYTELNKKIVKQQLQEVLTKDGLSLISKPERDIIFVDEACQITGYSKPTLYSKICRYELPVLSRGKPLTFSRKILIQWIHDGKPSVMDPEIEDYLKAKR
ncbi:helix-turn-helix domain-containing protein [Aquimarina muelleri]|uniref:helix-turn-helix domain-containing protein n=1 Tax=Aquimarina muelleri TaxID=279356 RepID=UPI003F683938